MLVLAVVNLARTILHKRDAKAFGYTFGRRKCGLIIPQLACHAFAVAVKATTCQVITGCLIEVCIGSFLSSLSSSFVNSNVMGDRLALLDLSMKERFKERVIWGYLHSGQNRIPVAHKGDEVLIDELYS